MLTIITLANAKSCFNVYPYELSAFVYLMQFVHIRGEQWSQGALWPKFIRFALDQNKKLICVWSFYWFERERAVGPYLTSWWHHLRFGKPWLVGVLVVR